MGNDGKARLFIALTADGPGTFLRPVHELLAKFPRAVKPVSPVNYHITLKFLGETAEDTFHALRQEYRELRPGIPAQPFTLRGLGAFPGMRRPQVFWCGLDCDRDAIERIRVMTEDLAVRHGFRREERKFVPHLTLARVRRNAVLPRELSDYFAAHRDTVFGDSRFDRIVLFKSDLEREGPVYTALEEIILTP
ncbi:MAG: RNA 2',3'-cyclic phosphodiesterase [Spirochaetes bacterium]|nr:RNA 2',3'-cyclic phosphodiesterase [Spirochaetota bacterium]